MTIREALFQQCDAYILERLQTIQNHINDIHDALSSETKNTSGDKHETGRAMLQLERESAGQQLAEVELKRDRLSKLKSNKVSNKVGLGSVVYTSKVNYFIAISAGAITINEETFYAVSPESPIAQALLSKEVNDEVQFRDQVFVITNIL
ncbi:3-oxoacyl-ACP synthase [Gaetbulibacter aestuarii]|uniref:3-oxoacyl-ACP synthase n=1 Tax=Gaetbulibacter aestuarii TaxID=1502358 RepID=A0ABW7MY39_9FLAO